MKDRPKAMHQGMTFQAFFSVFHITFAFFDCLPCQAWLITCMFDCHTLLPKVHPLPRMTLPLFNSHTLIFVPFLRLTTDSWACLDIRCMQLTARGKKVICLLHSDNSDLLHTFDVRSLQSIMTLSGKLLLHCTILPTF